jgi:hypothetical protein
MFADGLFRRLFEPIDPRNFARGFLLFQRIHAPLQAVDAGRDGLNSPQREIEHLVPSRRVNAQRLLNTPDY